MTHYQLNMAGIRWSIRSPMVFEPEEKITPFLTQEEASDIELSFTMGDPVIPGELHWEKQPRVHEENGVFWVERILAVRSKPSGCIRIDPKDPTHIRGWIYPEKIDDIRSLETLLDLSELEILLTGFDAISLHSSLIRWKGNSVLFTAPSGTGKSTQADLWEEHRDAEQLNGDRSLLRLEHGQWMAYGSPFAGSSAIYKNESAPIGAIVVLRQAKENTLTKLAPSEAFRLLYSETVIPKWNQDAHKKIIQLLIHLAENVPVMMLKCLPEESAVETLERELALLESFR